MLASSEDEDDDDESSSEENKLSNNQELQCKLLLLTSFPATSLSLPFASSSFIGLKK